MDGLKIAIVICAGLILAWAVHAFASVVVAPRALVVVPPAPAGTGCTVTFDAVGRAVVVCSNGFKMSCRP